MIEAPTIAIAPEEARIVLEILEARIPDHAVWIFGSRAKNRARRRSDLDLAIAGSERLPLDLYLDLKEDFLQSDLPYFVDVVDLHDVAPEFKRRIEPDFRPVSLLQDQLAEDPTPFDKLREHCGVMAVYNHPDAARLTYWGLYSLQHRGQESGGIASADGEHVHDIKGMGLVSEIFTDDVLAKLPGHLAIGHTRYSTTGDSALLNAQPISVDSTKGLIAIAHNGNLTNLGTARERLERDGAIFQTTSDSEIIVQLIAHSRSNTLVDGMADALSQVEGAFSIVMMTRNRIFAARDPHGFRPLCMGRIVGEDGAPDTFCFASETCALDLLHAKYERDVEPGELVMVSEEGVTSRIYSRGTPRASCIFEHVYFARPDSKVFGRWVQTSREEMGRQLARESSVPADLVVPVPDSGVTAAIGTRRSLESHSTLA